MSVVASSSVTKPVILVHGGAWAIPDAVVDRHVAGVRRAAEAGWLKRHAPDDRIARRVMAEELAALARLIQSRQKKLRAAALKLGARLYDEIPAKFCRRLLDYTGNQ